MPSTGISLNAHDLAGDVPGWILDVDDAQLGYWFGLVLAGVAEKRFVHIHREFGVFASDVFAYQDSLSPDTPRHRTQRPDAVIRNRDLRRHRSRASERAARGLKVIAANRTRPTPKARRCWTICAPSEAASFCSAFRVPHELTSTLLPNAWV